MSTSFTDALRAQVFIRRAELAPRWAAPKSGHGCSRLREASPASEPALPLPTEAEMEQMYGALLRDAFPSREAAFAAWDQLDAQAPSDWPAFIAYWNRADVVAQFERIVEFLELSEPFDAEE